MIWGIHYFTTKLKTKIDVIPRAALIKLYLIIYHVYIHAYIFLTFTKNHKQIKRIKYNIWYCLTQKGSVSYPNKQDTLKLCRFNMGPALKKFDHQYTNIVLM